MCRKKEEEDASIEDSVVASIQGFENKNSNIKNKKELLRPETAQKTERLNEQEKQNGKENNCMSISSDKLTKSYTRKYGYV